MDPVAHKRCGATKKKERPAGGLLIRTGTVQSRFEFKDGWSYVGSAWVLNGPGCGLLHVHDCELSRIGPHL